MLRKKKGFGDRGGARAMANCFSAVLVRIKSANSEGKDWMVPAEVNFRMVLVSYLPHMNIGEGSHRIARGQMVMTHPLYLSSLSCGRGK